jgi:hypothetical protein
MESHPIFYFLKMCKMTPFYDSILKTTLAELSATQNISIVQSQMIPQCLSNAGPRPGTVALTSIIPGTREVLLGIRHFSFLKQFS